MRRQSFVEKLSPAGGEQGEQLRVPRGIRTALRRCPPTTTCNGYKIMRYNRLRLF